MQGQRLQRQAGISLVGLIFSLAVLGLILLLGGQILPTYTEYRGIMNAVEKAKGAGSTVTEIRDSFNRSAEVNYISSITSRDLVIERIDGEMEISFEYEKKIPLVGPASLLMEYKGTTAKNKPGKEAAAK